VPFPRKLLGPGEEVVLEGHPNWSILVPRIALFIVVVAGSIAIIVEWASAPTWVGWALLVICWVFLMAVLAKVGQWRSTSIVLTNQRVVYRTGILRRVGREIPLDRVQDVTYTQSIFERVVGCGSLLIQSAGASGDEPFPDIRHPAVVQSLINRLITQSAGAGGGGGLGGRGPQAGYTPQPPPPGAVAPPPEYPPPGYQPPAYQQPEYQPPPYQQPSRYPPPAQYQPPQPTPQEMPTPPSPVMPIVPPAGASAAGPVTGSSSEMLHRLEQLLQLGVITPAEYEQKRREVIEGN
jgi:membrane protein YdbS with pleckstrin-like domain